MLMRHKIGVLAFHGDVAEHARATQAAAERIGTACDIIGARTAGDLEGLSGLIIPGGESTNLYKLCVREGMLGLMREVPAIFGTCAGAIMLAKRVRHAEEGQGTLGLMDIEADRNAYGRQADSFEEDIDTALGRVHAVFIRAPRIRSFGKGVRVLASRGGEAVACEQRTARNYLLAACFHPELSTTAFHERFLAGLS